MRYVTAQFLLAAKKSWLEDAGRQKDFEDVRLIGEYLAKHPATSQKEGAD